MSDLDSRIDRMLTLSCANSVYGKLGGATQQYGRAYRPGMWHLMKSDPHDAFDGWRGSHTHWVTADSDPCDDWPYMLVGGELVGFIAGFSLKHYSERLKHG